MHQQAVPLRLEQLQWCHSKPQFVECLQYSSRHSLDVTKIQTKEHLHFSKFLVQKSSLFCHRGRLNFQALHDRALRRLAESSHVSYKHYPFFIFFYLNIPYLKRKQFFFNVWVSQEMNFHCHRKHRDRCFCWFPAAIFVGHQTWPLHTKLYTSEQSLHI